MLPVNWKGTVAWSGATALATWMAAAPPVAAPGQVVPAVRIAPAPAVGAVPELAAAPDLADEAERLARRLEAQQAYSEPARDPFRFKVVDAAPKLRSASAPVAAAPVTPPPAVAAPPYVLVGIAEEKSGDATVRTAVVGGAGEVWLLKAGERVEGKFEVRAVDADAVELIRVDTGTALRLSFRP